MTKHKRSKMANGGGDGRKLQQLAAKRQQDADSRETRGMFAEQRHQCDAYDCDPECWGTTKISFVKRNQV